MRKLTLVGAFLCASCALLLGACGGSGGSTEETPPELPGPGDADTTFGVQGFAAATTTGDALGVGLLPDGRYVLVGETEDEKVFVTIFEADGTLDTDFSGDGTEIYAFTGPAGATDCAVQTNGMVVLAGRISVAGTDHTLVMRIDPTTGALDPTFHGGSHRIIDFGVASVALDVDVDGSGRIVIAGGADGIGGSDFAMARLHNSGAYDLGFSGDGRVRFHLGHNEVAFAVAQQSTGSCVLVGPRFGGVEDDAVAMRATSTGLQDLSFGTGGGLARVEGLGAAFADVALLPGDALALVGARAGIGMAVRLESDGQPDLAFGVGGVRPIDVRDRDQITSVVIQPNGMWVLAGAATTLAGAADVLFARLTPDGSFDPTFGVGGTQVLATGLQMICTDALLQSDGKIVGAAIAGFSPSLPFLVRIHGG